MIVGAGWGRGRRDDGFVADETLRSSAWRLSRAVRGMPRYAAVFSQSEGIGSSALARLCQLGDQFCREHAQRLVQVLRCRAETLDHWERAPGAGRIDARATLRRYPHGVPEHWAIQTTARHANTPVNRLVRAELDRVSRLVARLSALPALLPEQRILGRVRDRLKWLDGITPIGNVEVPVRSLVALRAEAARFPAELRPLRAFLAWCDEFRKLQLVALLEEAERPSEIDGHRCLEMAVALSVLAALGEAPGDGLTFVRGERRITATFDRCAQHAIRPPTLWLDWGEADAVIEARAWTGEAAAEAACDLELRAQHEPRRRHVLICLDDGPSSPALIRRTWNAASPLQWGMDLLQALGL